MAVTKPISEAPEDGSVIHVITPTTYGLAYFEPGGRQWRWRTDYQLCYPQPTHWIKM